MKEYGYENQRKIDWWNDSPQRHRCDPQNRCKRKFILLNRKNRKDKSTDFAFPFAFLEYKWNWSYLK